MTTGNEPVRGGNDFSRDLVQAAPVIWLCANLLLSLRGLWQGWPTLFAYDLPDNVATAPAHSREQRRANHHQRGA